MSLGSPFRQGGDALPRRAKSLVERTRTGWLSPLGDPSVRERPADVGLRLRSRRGCRLESVRVPPTQVRRAHDAAPLVDFTRHPSGRCT